MATGTAVPPIQLPEAATLSASDYVVVEVDGVFKKATIALVYATAEAANRYTQAEFRDAGDEINTDNKFLGKWSFDTTNSKPVYASGANPTDAWLYVSDDSTAHTPT